MHRIALLASVLLWPTLAQAQEADLDAICNSPAGLIPMAGIACTLSGEADSTPTTRPRNLRGAIIGAVLSELDTASGASATSPVATSSLVLTPQSEPEAVPAPHPCEVEPDGLDCGYALRAERLRARLGVSE